MIILWRLVHCFSCRIAQTARTRSPGSVRLFAERQGQRRRHGAPRVRSAYAGLSTTVRSAGFSKMMVVCLGERRAASRICTDHRARRARHTRRERVGRRSRLATRSYNVTFRFRSVYSEDFRSVSSVPVKSPRFLGIATPCCPGGTDPQVGNTSRASREPRMNHSSRIAHHDD